MPVMGDDAEERYKAPALDKGLDILELLSATEEGLSLAEIAKALNRSPNEIYRMLGRLVRRDYVVRTSAERYELSLKLFGLAHRHPPMRRLVSLALSPMRRFTRDAEQACHLVVYHRGGGVVTAQVDAPGYWGFAIRVGSHVSLLNTGSGHILLAFGSEAERRFMMDERSPVDDEPWPDGLDALLGEVRERGYEVRLSQQTVGVTNISVPILDAGGRCLAALTCPHLGRVEARACRSVEQLLELLLITARDISATAALDR